MFVKRWLKKLIYVLAMTTFRWIQFYAILFHTGEIYTCVKSPFYELVFDIVGSSTAHDTLSK